MARIRPLVPPYEPETEALLGSMMPRGVPPIALFGVFARNLEMTRAMGGWGSYELSKRLSLSLREREIAILRTCARCGCEYEWGVHVAYFAERAQLSREQLVSLTSGNADDSCWDVAERALIRAVDELHDGADLRDSTWLALSASHEDAQLLDLTLLCGWYHAISFAARVARVALEDFAPRFVDYGRARAAS